MCKRITRINIWNTEYKNMYLLFICTLSWLVLLTVVSQKTIIYHKLFRKKKISSFFQTTCLIILSCDECKRHFVVELWKSLKDKIVVKTLY